MLTNNILWAGSAPADPAIHNTESVPVVTYCIVPAEYPGFGNISKDPLLIGNSLRIPAASPCTDAGNNDAVPAGITTDFESLPRIVNGTVDIGAYEFQTESE